jgi:3-methyl-2-oxobutanoate hydroxymethyltransferase
MQTWNTAKFKQAKGKEKLVCLTAYDYTSARILDEAGVAMILVGDSLAMPVLGYANTIPVTVEQMLHHTAAVARGARRALVVADMPFMSYQVSAEQALANAGRFIKEAGAGAVKLEGGAFRAPLAETLVQNGIPVLGHIGLTPQSLHALGGYRVQGKTAPEAERLLEDARRLAEAGVFGLVLECVPAELGKAITAAVPVPTIGIGAGPHCDGQILVLHDMAGLYNEISPRFVKRYADLRTGLLEAVRAYSREVETGAFPSADQSY